MRIIAEELGLLKEVEEEPVVREVIWRSNQPEFVFPTRKRKLK
jgi:hypothetical protein